MENNEFGIFPEVEIEKPKFHLEVTYTGTEEIPVYDKDGNQTGTKTRVTGRIVKKVWDDPEELKKQRRSERKSLLNAFDKWEKAVLRGRESDDYAIMAWYKDLLDLKETAFANVPLRIQYYL